MKLAFNRPCFMHGMIASTTTFKRGMSVAENRAVK